MAVFSKPKKKVNPFAALLRKSEESTKNKAPEKTDAYMRKKASLMWNDAEWHSHVRPAFEIPIHGNLKFIAYINPVRYIELHFYRLGRSEDLSSWYSVGSFKAFGMLDEACETLIELMEEVGGEVTHATSALRTYVAENPYDKEKYADVEEWLANRSKK